MIGQDKIKYLLDDLINKGKFPRFSIIVGAEGSGRKTLIYELCKKLNMTCSVSGIKVDDIRHLITTAYSVSEPTLYLIPDADTMSNSAKSSLLKLTEEPPNNAYICMTLSSLDNTLPTILSRATTFMMNTYSPSEIYDYFYLKYSDLTKPKLLKVCDVPGDVDKVVHIDNDDFIGFVESVVDNIHKVSGSHSLKIGTKIAFKDETDKYDMNLFFKTFLYICLSRLTENVEFYVKGIQITSKYMSDLRVNGINKSMLFDMWVLSIREAWI